jgi:hypothetical protein
MCHTFYQKKTQVLILEFIIFIIFFEKQKYLTF